MPALVQSGLLPDMRVVHDSCKPHRDARLSCEAGEHVQGRVATLQALSGTGSLKIGAVFIQKFLPGTVAYVSDPTWGNHRYFTILIYHRQSNDLDTNS